MNHEQSKALRIAVASKNPVKIQAVRQAFEAVFPGRSCELEGFSVASGVSDQPQSDRETFAGASNRAKGLLSLAPESDFRVGIEGGIDQHGQNIEAFAWVVILDQQGQMGKARSASFSLPPAVVKLIAEGMELGLANDLIFGQSHSKQKGGAVGLLTHNLVDRTQLYAQAVILGCIPFIQKTLFAKQSS